MENIDRLALPTDDSCMEGMPDRMSERMPEDMPDKVPECLPDRMPERRRLSQAGASTLKKSKQGIGVSLVGGIKQIYTTWNESQRKSSVARLGQPS